MKLLLLIAATIQTGCSPSATESTAIQLDQRATAGTDVVYKSGNVTMEGYWATPSDSDGKRPTIIIVHDWNGIDAYEKMRADMIAALGYNAFCVDIYGKGIRPKTAQESGAEAGKYYADSALLRERFTAGLSFVQGRDETSKSEIGAMGYCFGGMTVLEMARHGLPLKGIVSFHGSLATKNPLTSGKFKGKALVCHGEADPVVPPSDVAALKAEMKAAAVDFKFVSYPDALHSFTIKGGPTTNATKYNEEADKGSWNEMKKFWRQVFH